MDEILTARDISQELRCSKQQAYKLMNGKVRGCPRLPTIDLGRKKVVRRTTFEKWKQESEAKGEIA